MATIAEIKALIDTRVRALKDPVLTDGVAEILDLLADGASDAGGGATIYSADGTLAGNRIVDTGGFNLSFINVTDFSFINGSEELLICSGTSHAIGFFPDDGTAHSEIIANANSLGAVNFVCFSDGGTKQVSIIGNGLTGVIEYDAENNAFLSVQEFADNAAASGGGLTEGMIYRTADALKIVHT